MTNKNIFELHLLKSRQTRARKLGFVEYADNFAIEQAAERLLDIKKKFKISAIVGGKARYWSEKLQIDPATLIPDGENLNLLVPSTYRKGNQYKEWFSNVGLQQQRIVKKNNSMATFFALYKKKF